MLKKAKIINLSLNSPKNISPNPLHISTDPSDEQLHNYSELKRKQIIEDCFQAINIISIERQKQQQKTSKISKIQTEPIKLTKKTSKECDVKLPLKTAQSIQYILKSFVKSKMEQQNHKLIGTSSKKRKLQQKNFLSRTMVLKTHNQNTESSYFNGSKQQFETEIFQNNSGNSKLTQKLNNKINLLESEITILKEKLHEKDELIQKLSSKQTLFRNKYKNQMAKMIRSQNILNINKFFEKELAQFNEEQYFLNIKGKNLKNSRRNDTSSANLTSKNNRNQLLEIPLILPTKRQNKISFQGISTSALLMRGQGNKQTITSQAALESIKNLLGKGTSNDNQSSQSCKQVVKRSKLKKQLEQLYKQKKKAIEDINKKNNLMEKQLEQLDAKIINKMEQISKEEQLITDDQIKLLKQEDFQELQLNGFYNSQALKLNLENQ